ncbi:uncharacterized protein LOC143621971 [Bidens hawaiensis]|uniref:uncharacterized protein LOC143621971 n=1 Tax=Bidens hawaiensis TaxID=980011 RepID=UPI00404ABF9D
MINGDICSTWDWRRQPASVQEMKELRSLLSLCQNVQLGVEDDNVEWGLGSAGMFSVSSIKEKINELTLTPVDYKFEWNNWVPGKVGILAWRAELDRVPVLTLLAKRNIGVESLVCPVCGLLDEMTEHAFVSCELAQLVWHAISTWCKAPPWFAFCVRDVLNLHKFTKFSKRKAKAFHAICLITLWCLWRVRNDMVHTGAVVTSGSVVENVKTLSFLWVKTRSGGSYLSWEDWERFVL